MADTYLVAGCAFTVPRPSPALRQGAVDCSRPLRVQVGGQPVILQTSAGLCLSAEQIPQGPPNVSRHPAPGARAHECRLDFPFHVDGRGRTAQTGQATTTSAT